MKDHDRPVPCPLRAAALASGDSHAIVGAEGTLSYADLDRRVSAATGELRRLGLADGARVGLYLPKGIRRITLMLAALRAGTTSVPLNTRVPPDGLPPLLKRAGCAALVSDDERVSRVAKESGLRVLRPEEVEGEAGIETGGGEVELSLDAPATIVFTSGSTGSPKAALHTFANHYFSALGSNENIALSPGDVWLHSLPLYHVGGISIFFRCLLSGATIALPEPDARLGRAIAETGASHVSLVATQLRHLLDEEADLGSLKAILLGASAMPEALLDEAHTRGLPVHASYGLTEMTSQATTTRPGASREELRTSGEALRYREVKVAPDGEVLVRGETLFAGYVEAGSPNGLDRPLDGEGWFHTKDTGELDGAGRLRLIGRKDNLFISGGENVQPEEVEDELRRFEEIEDAVVVPVPDAEFGERPVAFVRAPGGVPDDLAERLRATLPKFKVPVAFYPWPEDAPTGMKVDRRFFERRAGERE